ncbi:glycosyltransferase family 2 protein [Natrinema hispanicum]|uniref:Glycosyltransferase, catalytic subunit of cellulose synthase and poly-beta-1,6-N-acetylglucosamine synthase n=1 Tax=Natrinema hispanicum TaxID=392421 RepID=A0A1I0JWZ2_9EURY|nr:glycosyltransferase family 2 protein [Natrinema hispanicum]SEU14518.1 Glycosyltransferase, catalytic subunit of cellulose synthase and poly-beta-1,6-N-acetylglucosamine synthase [Natrinema hispanicum]
MYREHSVGVVIPAYNEEGFVGDVIREMPDYVDRMYLIDDCSTDDTWDEIHEAARDDADGLELEYTGELDDSGEKREAEIVADGGQTMLEQRAIVEEPIGRVVPIQHRVNLGAGGAIKTGYLAALEDKVDIVPTVDGDGQMDLSQLPRLMDPIVEDEADYAKGNRLLYKEFRSNMPPFRFFGNSILTFLTKVASGYWKTMDPQNGYTAISHYALANVGIENMYEYYGYCNDLLVKLNAKGMRVADVVMPAVYGDEESSINYTTYIRKVSGMLLRNFFWRLKVKYLVLDFHPLALFYLFGAAMAGLGIVGGLWSLYAKFVLGDPLFVRASASLLLFSIGSMFVMFAMLFDMQANENREVQVRD